MAKPDRISALPVPEESALDDDIRKLFAKAQEKLGFVPNVFRAYALNQDRLRGFLGLRKDIFDGEMGLSLLEREMIGVVVSSVNRCYYCLTSHSHAVRQLSNDGALADQLVMNYRAAELSPRHKAMLDFAWKLTEEPAKVTEEDRDRLRAAGFEDRDILDICCVVGFFNMSNRVATGIDIEPNEEYQR